MRLLTLSLAALVLAQPTGPRIIRHVSRCGARRGRDRPRLRRDQQDQRSHANPAGRHQWRAVVRRQRRVAGARHCRRHRRHDARLSDEESSRSARRRLLGAGVRQRLHEVRARRWPHRVDAHGSVGRAELEAIARQHRGHSGEDPFRSCIIDADRARRRQGDPGDRAARRYGVSEVFEDPERDPHEVVGPSDFPWRDRPVAGRLRRASGGEISGRLQPRTFPVDDSRKPPAAAASAAGSRSRARSTCGCSTHRRTTTTRTA